MILSRKGSFVILAPWKTATQTIRARLHQVNESPYSPFFHFNLHLGKVSHQHLTLSEFLRLPEAKYVSCRAVFVRNPYDRVVSGFGQIQRDIVRHPHCVFPSSGVRDEVIASLAKAELRLADAGGDLNRWVENLEDYEVLDEKKSMVLPMHPCSYWTHIDGNKRIDYLGKVESFEQDFATLVRVLALDAERIPAISANIGSQGYDLQGYRHANKLGRRARDRINELFKDDFELFGYEKL